MTEAAGAPQLGEEDLAIIRLSSRGLTASAVGRRLDLSDRTVRRRLHALCEVAGVDSTIELVVWAVRRGLV